MLSRFKLFVGIICLELTCPAIQEEVVILEIREEDIQAIRLDTLANRAKVDIHPVHRVVLVTLELITLKEDILEAKEVIQEVKEVVTLQEDNVLRALKEVKEEVTLQENLVLQVLQVGRWVHTLQDRDKVDIQDLKYK